jgi:signal transduction histidine kinase
MSIFELLHPDDLEHTRAGFELTQVGQPAIRFANRYRCKDGSYRWISWVGIPEDGFVYCTGRDITAERAAEIELAATQEALRQSQKMEAVGHLTGGIAHDINNLLTGIIGSLDLVRRRMATDRPGDIPRFMDAASTSALRAAALTHRLLAFARRQSLDTRPNDINRLVASMEDLLHRTLGEQIELQSTLAADLWTAFADANQLENALLNLAINARDAMPDGGRLTIETANAVLDTDYTSLHADVEPGDYVVVSVSDTGTGMPPDVVTKAVDPFFTTKPVGEGTGLGLSMIYGFAKQSGGHLRIYSEVGQGTTVKLYLPRALQDAVDLDTSAVDTPRGQGETILVVEDDTTVRLIVSDVLEELGYHVLVAPDARPAIPLLRSDQRIDLMISDVVLPHINGRKLAEIARASRPDLKVLFVSGYAENATFRGDVLDSGMDMLTKPFALDALAAKVRMMIER